MFLFTNPLWKICMKYLHVSLWLDDSRTKFAAQFGEAFSYKTMKNNKYLCQKYFTQLFGTTKTFMLFKNKHISKKIAMTCMLASDFHANQIVFVWSCVKRLGTNGFKFPAKGSLPVILSSMLCPDRQLLIIVKV